MCSLQFSINLQWSIKGQSYPPLHPWTFLLPCKSTDFFFVSLILAFRQVTFSGLIQRVAMCTLEVGHRKQQGKGSGLLERRRKDKTNLFWQQRRHLLD